MLRRWNGSDSLSWMSRSFRSWDVDQTWQLPPPFGLAAVAPVSRITLTQRIAVATLTRNRAAAPGPRYPIASTAPLKRERRSSDSVFASLAGLPVQPKWWIKTSPRRGEP